MNELNVRINQTEGTIDFNSEELKEQLAIRMDLYKTAVVTLENRTERKKDVATLRKLKNSVEDRRKEVKSVWMKPYESFESKVKEIAKLIDEPILLIDSQVKELEEAERLKKKSEIESYFAQSAGDLTEWLVIDKIYDSRWENASVSMKKAKEELDAKLNEIKAAIATLSMSISDVKEEAIERYKLDLNLTGAMAYINQYEAQKARIQAAEEKRRRREEEEHIQREMECARQEARRQVQEENRIKEETRQQVIQEVKAPISDEIVSNAKVSAVYAVSAPEESLRELEMAMDSLGITWSRKEI